MSGARLLPLFLSAAIFFLQGGDCVSPFFADQKSHDCCRKSPCNRTNPDPCCQVSSNASVSQDQAKDKMQHIDSVDLQVLSAWTGDLSLGTDPSSDYGSNFAPS